jgi:hypothetical protein
MCQSGVTCLPTHLFSLLDTNNFISEGGRGAWDFFMSVSRESIFFFKHQVDQKYLLCIHEVKDTCIRDLKK